MRIATDVGGTFTDLVYCYNENGNSIVRTKKVQTTPGQFEKGVFNSLESAELDFSGIDFFAHGSTVVINALTERKGVKTGLITTRGFRDVLEIARGNRPDFFNLRYAKPKPFVPRYLRAEVTERVFYDGTIREDLVLAELDEILNHFQEQKVEAIAICFLHAYSNPKHELQALEYLRKKSPEMTIVASHEITREWREYERTNTTVLNAYIQPIAVRYLQDLQDGLVDRGYHDTPYIMQSNGGIDTLSASQKRPITLVESGPASGVLAAASLGKLLGEENVIAFDIGGTTAKCSLIPNGNIQTTSRYMIERTESSAGYPIMAPVIDLVEIGNGGGSIAWVDEDKKLHVGPQSAGATPGPAAYGLGGTNATTTDANLVMQRINPDYFMGGQLDADMDNVFSAFERLANDIDLPVDEVARGVIRIANNNMVNALKLVSVNRGYDPRDFTMIAFGGGGSMHAAALADELKIPKVIIPMNSSVFSAWGMLLSDLRRDHVQTRLLDWNTASIQVADQTFTEMKNAAKQEFLDDGVAENDIYFEQFGHFRYSGQEHTVSVDLTSVSICENSYDDISEQFHSAHESEFTFRLSNDIELLSFHVVAFAHVDKPNIPELRKTGRSLSDALKKPRKVDFDSHGVLEAQIYDRDLLEPEMTFTGPSVIEESGTTTVIFPGQNVHVDHFGNLILTTA